MPIRDVTAARSFWEELGYGFSDVFRQDDQCECLQISDSIFAMLLSRDMYATFTSKTIIDARTTSGALLCLSAPSREAVDELVDRAIAAGGADTTREGQLQEDSMYGRAFEDPDGRWTPPLPRADPGAPTTGGVRPTTRRSRNWQEIGKETNWVRKGLGQTNLNLVKDR